MDIGILKEIAQDIKKNMTPVGIWTIWIPLTLCCWVMMGIVMSIITPCVWANKKTNGFLPATLKKIESVFFMKSIIQ